MTSVANKRLTYMEDFNVLQGNHMQKLIARKIYQYKRFNTFPSRNNSKISFCTFGVSESTDVVLPVR